MFEILHTENGDSAFIQGAEKMQQLLLAAYTKIRDFDEVKNENHRKLTIAIRERDKAATIHEKTNYNRLSKDIRDAKVSFRAKAEFVAELFDADTDEIVNAILEIYDTAK